MPVEESLWTVPIFRQWPLSFRAFNRSTDKSLRDFLKGRHGVFLRGVYRVEVPEPQKWRRAGTKPFYKCNSYCHCIFVGFADLCGLRPGFVGDAGLTSCIPTVLKLRYSGRLSHPKYYSETGRTERPPYRLLRYLPT